MKRIEIEIPTEMNVIAEQARDMLQKIVDIAGEKNLPKVLAYVQSNPAKFELMFKGLLKAI